MTKRTMLTSLADRIRTDAGTLRPERLLATFSDWTRGGLPASSMGGPASRTGEQPMPAFDRDDRAWQRILDNYRTALVTAARHLALARRIEQAYLPPDPADREQYGLWRSEQEHAARRLVGPNARACTDCRRIVACSTADPIRNDRCAACNMRARRRATSDK